MGRTKKAGKPKAGKDAPAAEAAGGAADDGPSTSYDATLPDNLELVRTRVVCGTDRNLHVSAALGKRHSRRKRAAAAARRGAVESPPFPHAPPCAAAACCRRHRSFACPAPPGADVVHGRGQPVGQHGRGRSV